MKITKEAPVISFEKYRLDNGLQVIFHCDRKLPVSHVNLWYHVGSKNELPGRTGLAHLFEHMMFQGSKHADGEYLTYMEKAGANMREGGVNGTTSFDRTNYFETVPNEALEYVLWLESDRMGYLAEALTQEKFDNQREVVKNERRQNYENVPYGRAIQLIFENLFPPGHPYSWIVIGSQEDLNNTTLQETKDFFNTHYSPNNCSLVVAGDFDVKKARSWVDRYFGSLPSGPALHRPKLWIPKLEGERNILVSDRVPLERLYLVWPTPAYFQPGDAELDIASRILSQGKNSRLYKTLVYEKQIASDVSAFNYSLEISGLFGIVATVRPGESLQDVQSLISEEISMFAESGPTLEELVCEKAKQEFEFISGLERLGGFGGKSDLLNQYNTLLGDPGYFKPDYHRYQSLSVEGVQESVKTYLQIPERVVLTFTPELSGRSKTIELNRGQSPGIGSPRAFKVPILNSKTLSNGMTLVVAERHDLPKVALSLLMKSGSCMDPILKPGIAWMTTEMLIEGTKSRSALQIQEELDRLGISLGLSTGFESCQLMLETLKPNLKTAFQLISDLVLNSTFPEQELGRQRKQRLDGILQEKNNPAATARRVFLGALFGKNHPFGLQIAGDEASVKTISQIELLKFHNTYWKPINTILLAAGDITMNELDQLVDQELMEWKNTSIPELSLPNLKLHQGIHMVLVDRQDAPQSQIRIGSIGPSRKISDYYGIELMNAVLGGSFSSRLNLNLREDKGYTYGASTGFAYGREIGYWSGGTAVQTKVTVEALNEFLKEINSIRGSKEITNLELNTAKQNLIRGFSQRFETLERLVDQAADLFSYDLSLETLSNYPEEIESISLAQTQNAAEKYLQHDQLLIVIVGDLSQFEAKLRALNLGQVTVMDAEGTLLKNS